MIRYDKSRANLETLVDAEDPQWRRKAGEVTNTMKKGRRFIEGPSWSKIKNAYRAIQYNKCAYCERLLPGPTGGSTEHDVEHFRPKNVLKDWKPAKDFDFPIRSGRAEGYYWLAYNLENYCTSCKTCNSELKSNCFPIEGIASKLHDNDIARVNMREKPFLPYPIGRLDDDPETILTFEGLAPIPVRRSGRKHRRARVLIRFFNLDLREELIQERAIIICSVWRLLKDLASDDAENAETARAEIEMFSAPNASHCNFARAYVRLFESNPAEAARQHKIALEYRREQLAT